MWSNYFSKGEFVGVDINPNCKNMSNDKISIRIVDLSKVDELKSLTDIHPNIIIDDASHIWSHQLKALFLLFPSLLPGGIYILEDLETSFSSYRFMNYDDAAIAPYDVLSAISEVVTSREHLRLENKHPLMAKIFDDIENISIQIEMISFIHGSCIIVKR